MVWKLSKRTLKQTVWKNQSKNQMLTIAKGDKMWTGFLETLNKRWIGNLNEHIYAITHKEAEIQAKQYMRTY